MPAFRLRSRYRYGTRKKNEIATGITFVVSDVERATRARPESHYSTEIAKALQQEGGAADLEAYSRSSKLLVDADPESTNAFIYAANLAYDEHRPLVMSPDMIWLLIAQGVALHINANADTMRHRFVAGSGKSEIVVVRDEFLRGFVGNDWESVFSEFSTKIKAHVGDQGHRLIVRRFSTTGIVEQAAFEVTLMNAFQSYFNYTVVTRCGIPEITLEGTSDDWESVRTGVEALSEYDLVWWTEHLLPVLDQFVAASKGDIDRSFWRSFYKRQNASGGPYINGHVVNLFPYLVKTPFSPRQIEHRRNILRGNASLSTEEIEALLNQERAEYGKPFRNEYLGWKEPDLDDPRWGGMSSCNLPSGYATAPFTWSYVSQKLPMEFVAGFIGVVQNTETLALRPEIGWAVRDRGA